MFEIFCFMFQYQLKLIISKQIILLCVCWDVNDAIFSAWRWWRICLKLYQNFVKHHSFQSYLDLFWILRKSKLSTMLCDILKSFSHFLKYQHVHHCATIWFRIYFYTVSSLLMWLSSSFTTLVIILSSLGVRNWNSLNLSFMLQQQNILVINLQKYICFCLFVCYGDIFLFINEIKYMHAVLIP
jgi:hypothetical protein